MIKETNQSIQTTAREQAVDYLDSASRLLSSRKLHADLTTQWDNGSEPEVTGLVERLAEKFDRGNVDLQVQLKDPRLAVVVTYKQGPATAEYDFEVEKAGKYAALRAVCRSGKSPAEDQRQRDCSQRAGGKSGYW
ncbi:MAG: hypothetical protein R3C11_03785 [Planctomycetaceae bacterium]